MPVAQKHREKPSKKAAPIKQIQAVFTSATEIQNGLFSENSEVLTRCTYQH
jgi:hypothetical protein